MQFINLVILFLYLMYVSHTCLKQITNSDNVKF